MEVLKRKGFLVTGVLKEGRDTFRLNGQLYQVSKVGGEFHISMTPDEFYLLDKEFFEDVEMVIIER